MPNNIPKVDKQLLEKVKLSKFQFFDGLKMTSHDTQTYPQHVPPKFQTNPNNVPNMLHSCCEHVQNIQVCLKRNCRPLYGRPVGGLPSNKTKQGKHNRKKYSTQQAEITRKLIRRIASKTIQKQLKQTKSEKTNKKQKTQLNNINQTYKKGKTHMSVCKRTLSMESQTAGIGTCIPT